MKGHIHPVLEVQLALGLRDKKTGERVRWSSTRFEGYRDRTRGKLINKKRTLILTDESHSNCRETLANDFLAFVEYRLEPWLLDHQRDLELIFPRKTETAISYSLVGYNKKADAYGPQSNKIDNDLYVAAYELIKSESLQRKLFRLMDVVLGTTSLLVGGPGTYVRTESNKLFEKVEIHEDYDHNGKPYKEANAVCSYTGISSAFARHPTGLSIIYGLGRFCIQLMLEGHYDKLKPRLDLTNSKKRIKALSKKKELSKSNIDWLLKLLHKLRPYWETPNVRSNLGAYPLNEYTWGMFKKLVKELSENAVDPVASWCDKDKGNIYGYSAYGFYEWCRAHPKQTTAFRKNGRRNWSGTAGNTVWM